MPTTSVRRRISLFSRSWGLFDQIWGQSSRGNAGERQQVIAGGVEVFGGGRELLVQRVDDPVELGVDLGGVGWSKMCAAG